jgi:outer membrane phospholipase A
MSERSESKRIDAKQHKNSGRGKIKKGDATWKNFVVDFMEYPKGMRIDQNVWAKAVTDAMKSNADPAIILVMGEGNAKTRLAVIELSLLEQILERENDEENLNA